MIRDTAFEQWLATATRKLAPDAVERIRTEIGEHYQSALASGCTPEQAIAALGNPKQANRGYRKVFLTEDEARLADTSTSPKRAFRRYLTVLAVMAAVAYFFPRSVLMWTFVAFFWLGEALRFLYPPNNQERSRNYLVGNVIGCVVVCFVPGASELRLGCVLGLGWVLDVNYRRWTIFRKLAGKPAPLFVPRVPPPLPGQPLLTRCEAVFLSQMPRSRWREFALRVVMLPCIALMALAAVVAPLLIGPITTLSVLRFVLPCVLNLYTPARSRRLLKAKLTVLALGVILPPFQLLMPIFSRSGKPLPIGLVLGFMVIPLVIFFVDEYWKINIRRKLPVEEWPKALYL